MYKQRLASFLLLVAFSGACVPPPQEEVEEGEVTLLTKASLALLNRWAPINYQAVSRGSGEGYYGKGDYLARIDYDGDWKTRNNWDNLKGTPVNKFEAVAYVAMAQSKSHWFLYYMFYHPIDWTSNTLEGEHENDAESVYLLVRKDGSEFGTLEAVLTEAHGGKKPLFVAEGVEPVLHRNTFPHGKTTRTVSTVRNVIRWEPHRPGESFPRLGIYQEAEGHGIYPCGYDDVGSSSPDSRVFNCNNPGDVGIKYVPAITGGAPSEPIGSWSEVSYGYKDLQNLFRKRDNFDIFFDAPWGSVFAGDKSPGCGDGYSTICRPEAAHPTWDGSDDPIEMFTREFNFAEGKAPSYEGFKSAFPGFHHCEPGPDEVSVFTDENFQGQCVTYAIDPDTKRKAVYNFGRNYITSIKVGDNVDVVVFENQQFWPGWSGWQDDTASVGVHSDKIQSLLVIHQDRACGPATEPGPGELIFYDDVNFTGICTIFDRNDGDVSEMGYVGFPNDRLGAVKVGQGASVTLYVDPGFRGRELTLEEGNHNVPATLKDVLTGFRMR